MKVLIIAALVINCAAASWFLGWHFGMLGLPFGLVSGFLTGRAIVAVMEDEYL